MADHQSKIVTNQDLVDSLVDVVNDESTKIIFMNVAVVDFRGDVLDDDHKPYNESARARLPRLDSKKVGYNIELRPETKFIKGIRRTKKHIFLVGFKMTCGATEDEQYLRGLELLKGSSCNLVLANDVETRRNMIITPEEARYHVTTDRNEALRNLVEMAYLRSHLTFTRSTVVDGTPVSWDDSRVPSALRTVVNFCIKEGAYKPFMGATVGHFAAKLEPNVFLTSRRKTNFNKLKKDGLVLVKTDGPDSVIAYGSKPSVGGQSQRIVFDEHPDYDCIVHFHCPKRDDSKVPMVSQREYECGSHQCGQNTSRGLKKFGSVSAVYLENHGPNIVFNRRVDPNEVIDFIINNFDLTGKTGGYVELPKEPKE